MASMLRGGSEQQVPRGLLVPFVGLEAETQGNQTAAAGHAAMACRQTASPAARSWGSRPEALSTAVASTTHVSTDQTEPQPTRAETPPAPCGKAGRAEMPGAKPAGT